MDIQPARGWRLDNHVYESVRMKEMPNSGT
jgi:hypothetical protein